MFSFTFSSNLSIYSILTSSPEYALYQKNIDIQAYIKNNTPQIGKKSIPVMRKRIMIKPSNKNVPYFMFFISSLLFFSSIKKRTIDTKGI